jgi:outer membrane immunogenic protein
MRIVQLLLSSAFAAVTASTAFAAYAQAPGDLHAAGGAPPAFTWTGPYIGINLGDDFDGRTRFDQTTGTLPNNTSALNLGLRPGSHNLRSSGFTGGAQVGYNYELGNSLGYGGMAGGLVAGVEADAAYTDIHRTDTLSNTTNYGPLDTPGAPPTTRVNQYQGDLNFLGTVRGRLGVAFQQVLIYGTGGFAYGDVHRRTTFYGPNAPTTPFFTGDSNGMKTGFAYGGGIEYAVPTGSFLDRFNILHASAVTIKAEYLHYDLGSDTLRFPGVNGGATIGGYTSRVRTDGDLARAGINYKF